MHVAQQSRSPCLAVAGGTKFQSHFFKPSNFPCKAATTKERTRQSVVQTVALFGGGKAKVAQQAYICKDCGYIYDGRDAFEGLDKSYRCPVCSAPKRRFGPYNAPVSKGVNNTATRKERKAELQANSGGGLNPGAVIAVGAAVVLGTFFYLNTVY